MPGGTGRAHHASPSAEPGAGHDPAQLVIHTRSGAAQLNRRLLDSLSRAGLILSATSPVDTIFITPTSVPTSEELYLSRPPG